MTLITLSYKLASKVEPFFKHRNENSFLDYSKSSMLESGYNEPLHIKVIGITNSFLCPNNNKMYGKEPQYSKTSLARTNFPSPLALCYIEVPLYDIILRHLNSAK